MFLIWIVPVLIILFSAVCLTVLRVLSKDFAQKQANLQESLWARRSRMPILLELIAKSGFEYDKRKELIDLRFSLQSGAFSLEEEVNLEAKLNSLLADIWQKTEFEEKLKTDALFLSLKKELEDCLESIRIALNDYNFSIQKWQSFQKQLWLSVFGFCFEINKKKPIKLL